MQTDPHYRLDKHTIAQSFGKAAKTYDEAAVFQRVCGERLLARSDFLRMKPSAIRDLGCGTGLFTRLLAKKYSSASITGLDLSFDMTAFARAHRGWFSKQTYLCADIQSLPFVHAQFDFIFSNLVLHWLPLQIDVWKEISRVLKPGGVFMFTMPGPDTLKELRASWASVDEHAHVNSFVDMHEVGDRLLQAGFCDPVMDRQDFVMHYAELNALFRDLKNTGVTHRRSENKHGLTGKKAFQSMQDFYQQFKTPEGKFPATYEIIYGQAFKSEQAPREQDSIETRIAISDIGRVQR